MILAGSPSIDLDRRAPHYPPAFAGAALLVVEEGFVVVRATFLADVRSVVTVVSADARDQLLASPALARRIVDQLVVGLAQRQEALTNFAPTRHIERVRRKLLQLARRYGHVVRDGIRIDVPLSHALLAEMIGSSRETVTRALDELQRDRFVVCVGSTYRLLVSADSLVASPR